jgi:hypothetical protein
MVKKKKVYKPKSVKFAGMTITAKKTATGWHAVVIGKSGGRLPGVSGATFSKSIARTKALMRKAGAKANPCNLRANPLRHFPKLKGRGRPSKVRSFELTTVLKGGAVAVKKFKGTKDSIYAKAQRIMKRKFHGKPVKEVIVDDGR